MLVSVLKILIVVECFIAGVYSSFDKSYMSSARDLALCIPSACNLGCCDRFGYCARFISECYCEPSSCKYGCCINGQCGDEPSCNVHLGITLFIILFSVFAGLIVICVIICIICRRRNMSPPMVTYPLVAMDVDSSRNINFGTTHIGGPINPYNTALNANMGIQMNAGPNYAVHGGNNSHFHVGYPNPGITQTFNSGPNNQQVGFSMGIPSAGYSVTTQGMPSGAPQSGFTMSAQSGNSLGMQTGFTSSGGVQGGVLVNSQSGLSSGNQAGITVSTQGGFSNQNTTQRGSIVPTPPQFPQSTGMIMPGNVSVKAEGASAGVSIGQGPDNNGMFTMDLNAKSDHKF